MIEQQFLLISFICPRHRDVVIEQFALTYRFCPCHRDVVIEQFALTYLINSPFSFSVLMNLYLFVFCLNYTGAMTA